MSLPITLSTIGQVHTETFNFLEQVSAITGYQEDTSGLTATRTLQEEFAWGTDGVTYTAYQPLTTSNLAALTLDPDDRFYFRTKWTRTGTDATGFIDINRFALLTTIDPNAVSGHGKIQNTTFIADLNDLMQGILENHVIQQGGANHYTVKNITRENLDTQHTGLIWYYLDSRGANIQNYETVYSTPITFRVGVRYPMKMKGTQVLQPDRMASILMTQFDPADFGAYEYSLTLKGVVFNAVTLVDLGLSDPSVGYTVTTDGKGLINHELRITFNISWRKNKK